MSQIRCFVINLKKDDRKKQKVMKYLDNLDLDYEFIEAIDGNALSASEIENEIDKDKAFSLLGRQLSKGEVGCALSHLSVYHKIVEEKIEVALILEDDVKVEHCEAKENLNDIKQLLTGRLNHVDCILLGHHPKYSRHHNTVISLFERVGVSSSAILGWFTEQPVGAYAYLLTLNGAIKRLEEFERIIKPLDFWDLSKINVMGVKRSMFNVDFELESNLDKGRSKIVFQRTSYQKLKDLVRASLEKIKLDILVFRIRSKISSISNGIK